MIPRVYVLGRQTNEGIPDEAYPTFSITRKLYRELIYDCFAR